MTMIIGMMMSLLHGTITIKNAKKAKIKEELMPIVGIHQSGGMGVCQKTKMKGSRKYFRSEDEGIR